MHGTHSKQLHGLLISILSMTNILATSTTTYTPYNVSNGCIATDDNSIIYIIGGQPSAMNDIPFKKTDDILVWDISSVYNVEVLNTNAKLTLQCHQNAIRSSITNDLYLAGAINARYTRSGSDDTIKQYLTSITASYYVFDLDTMDYDSFSPDTTDNNIALIRSCAAIAKDRNVLISFGGQSVNEMIWIQNELELNQRLSTFNTTNILQVFDLNHKTWIEPIYIEDAPLDAMESGCFADDEYYYVIGGKSIQNGRSHVLSEIMRYNIPQNEWNIIMYLPTKLCYPKAFAAPQYIMQTSVFIAGHQSCGYNAIYQFYAFNHETVSIQYISDLSLKRVWNPMIEIVNGSIVVFGGTQLMVHYDGSMELTANKRSGIWFNKSLQSLLATNDDICNGGDYDAAIKTPIQVMHRYNETNLFGAVNNLSKVIEIVYHQNGITDVYIAQRDTYLYIDSVRLNIITCVYDTDAKRIYNYSVSKDFANDIAAYFGHNITIDINIHNITTIYFRSFDTMNVTDTMNIYDATEHIQYTDCVGMKHVNDYVLMFPLCIALFFLLIIILDFSHVSINSACCYKSDTKHTLLLSLTMLRVCDIATDIILSIEIVLYYVECNEGNPFNLLFILSLCSITCISLPWFINVLSMIRITKLQNVVIERPAIWFKKYMLFYVFLVIISGDCYSSTVLISSNLFALGVFNSGLNMIQHESIRYTTFTTIMFESIPQIFIQFTYGYFILKDVNTLIILSLILSLLSSVINSFSWCLDRNINAKIGMIQYSLNIKMYPDDEEGGRNRMRSTMNEELSQIKTYRGCRSQLRKQIASELGVKEAKLEIGYIQMLADGCNIQIIQTLVDAPCDENEEPLFVHELYKDHLYSIEAIIKYVYNLKWNIEINIECNNGNMRDKEMLSKAMSSQRQLLVHADDSSAD